MSGPGDEQRADERQPAANLLPEVYAELRRLAAALTVGGRPGQTLQPTALVHEAFLRLVGGLAPSSKPAAVVPASAGATAAASS
jgi:hypothetical protein